MSYLKIYLILKKIDLTDMLRGKVCVSSRRGWGEETPEKVQLKSQPSPKAKMIFPLQALVSYRHLLSLRKKRKKEWQPQKEKWMMELQSHPSHLAQVPPAAKKCFMWNKENACLGKAVTSHPQCRLQKSLKNKNISHTRNITLKWINTDSASVSVINNWKNLHEYFPRTSNTE